MCNNIFFKLVVPFSFVISLLFPALSFCGEKNEKKTSDEIIIRIDDSSLRGKHMDSKELIDFAKPGSKKVIIENYSSKDIEVGYTYFIGDDFTSPLVAKDLSIQGSSGCSKINANTSCSIKVTADEKATSTANPEGLPLILGYKVSGKEEDKFIHFKVRSNYNNHLGFKVRNIVFTEKTPKNGNENSGNWFSGKLEITNKDSESIIHVRDVKLARDDKLVGKVYRLNPSECNNLEKDGSCKIAFNVSSKDEAIFDGKTLPIWIAYDIDYSVDGKKVTKSGLVDVAAAVFKTHETQVGRSLLGGIFSMGTVLGSSLGYDGLLGRGESKSLFLTVLRHNKVAGHLIAAIGGGGLILADKGVDIVDWAAGLESYNGRSWINGWVASTAYYISMETAVCLLSKESCLGYLVPALGCRLAAKLVNNFVSDKIFSSIVYRLPEQKSWLGVKWDDAKLVFNFGLIAGLRMLCKGYFGLLGDDYKWKVVNEISEDVVSAGTMVGIEYLLSSDKFSSPLNGTLPINDFIDNYCDEYCVCAELSKPLAQHDDAL